MLEDEVGVIHEALHLARLLDQQCPSWRMEPYYDQTGNVSKRAARDFPVSCLSESYIAHRPGW